MYKQNIELCFNNIKLMLFWNGVNVIDSITFFTSIHKNFSTKNNINDQSEPPDVNNIKEHVKVNFEKAP